MISDLENRLGQSCSVRRRLTAKLLLWAMLVVVYAPAFSLSQTLQAPDGKIYCPLSKKFQLVKPPEKSKVQKPFEFLCAGAKTKEFLFSEIILKNPLGVFSLDADGIEKLTFETLAVGHTTLEKFPYAPGKPFESFSRQIASVVAVKNNNLDQKSSWKHSIIAFSFVLAARPPTPRAGGLFPTADSTYRSAGLSRHLAPRAPPLFS